MANRTDIIVTHADARGQTSEVGVIYDDATLAISGLRSTTTRAGRATVASLKYPDGGRTAADNGRTVDLTPRGMVASRSEDDFVFFPFSVQFSP